MLLATVDLPVSSNRCLPRVCPILLRPVLSTFGKRREMRLMALDVVRGYAFQSCSRDKLSIFEPEWATTADDAKAAHLLDEHL